MAAAGGSHNRQWPSGMSDGAVGEAGVWPQPLIPGHRMHRSHLGLVRHGQRHPLLNLVHSIEKISDVT